MRNECKRNWTKTVKALTDWTDECKEKVLKRDWLSWIECWWSQFVIKPDCFYQTTVFLLGSS